MTLMHHLLRGRLVPVPSTAPAQPASLVPRQHAPDALQRCDQSEQGQDSESPSAEGGLVRALEAAGTEPLSEYQGRYERQESMEITRRHQALETEKQHAHRV